MKRRYYRFCGTDVQIEMREAIFYTEDRRLEPFLTHCAANPHVFTFDFAEQLPQPEGACIAQLPSFKVYATEGGHVRYIGGDNPYIRAEHIGKKHTILLRKNMYSGRVGTKSVLECLEAEHLIARNNGFIFHCSYIDIGGKAILFTAPSETGKSTQADLWHELRGAEIINGDRAAVRMIDGVATAEGIPFAGSSQYCLNRSLPIAAIVYLGQAPVTTIRKMRGYEAFSKIWEGVSVNTWDRTDVELVSGAVKQVVETVPVYHMPCTPDESAVIALENVL